MSADERFDEVTKEMIDKFLEHNPDYATQLGLHDPYDYLLPDGSTARLLKNLELEEQWLNQLEKTVKRRELNDEHKLDWEVIERVHEFSRFSFYEHRLHELNPDAFDILGGLVFLMLTRDYAPLEKRMDAIASRLERAPKYLEEFRSRFDKSHPVKLWTEVAIESAQSIGGLFQFLLQIAKGQVSDKAYGRLSRAVEGLMPELEKHLKWLNSLLPRTTENWALGKEKYEKLIRLRDLGMTSEQILRLGEDYLRKLKAERKLLAQQIAPGKTVEYVIKKIESDAPKTFEEALKFTEKTMQEAKEFVQKKGIATVYTEDKLYVRETPEFIAPLIPFAALMMPAKYDKPQIGVYIVTRPKDVANLGNHLNYKSVRNTAVHEAYPGHFLQGAVSNRHSIIRLLPNGVETTEGWAHYCEEMMAEKGFITDNETKLIQINDVIWRAVRMVVDVKLSRGEMTFDDAVRMLVEETGMSKEGATAEVRRYTQTPAYPLSYLLGKHLILQLKSEITEKMGSKFNERFFHDTLIANGYLPLSLVRKVFKQKLEQMKA
ncbi:MAG: DUF885 domain-containing protein [Candidatus Bathyarchaeia archaeon]